ncbi:MAG TPA: hypothetical protein PKD86_06625 [Gemmatales bacterium]|nr:hypothetical protein [Gemmatales bacterium]HMP59011.1 hypothetical protein [Gemmatales bacterium]
MQLEQLQAQWRQLDQTLKQTLALQQEVFRQAVIAPARRRVHWLAFWPGLDVAFCCIVMLLGGAFLSSHWSEPRLVVPAAVVMAAALALLISSVRQLVLLGELDWSGPVAAIQHALQRLKVQKIRQFKWVMLLAPLVGFSGLVVGLQAGLGWLTDGRVDVVERLGSAWMLANYAFGLAFVPVGGIVADWLARRYQGQGWWRAVLDDISGASLNAAAREVERWVRLEQGAEIDAG